MDVDLARMPKREPGMNGVEVMTSESQERMLAIVTPANLDAVLDLCRRWEIRASVIGRVTDTARFRVYDGLFDAVGVPGANPPVPRGDAPPACRPTCSRWPTSRSRASATARCTTGPRPRPPTAPRSTPTIPRRCSRRGSPPAPTSPASCSRCSASPTIADKSWVYRQYDHQLFLNTVVAPGRRRRGAAAEGHRRARSRSPPTARRRFCALDPYAGARLTVIEAARNLACVGAVPKALVNCLNFGNPEHPEVMWQFAEVVDGMSDACRALGIPVVGGNVSFYNESRGRDIDPTPVVGVVGLIDELDVRAAAGRAARR